MLRFVAAFLLICLYMALWLPIFWAIAEFSGSAIAWLLPLAFLAIFISMPIAIDRIAKLLYRFKAEAQPISLAELQEKILAINSFDVPVTVERRGWKLSVTWRYLDAKWWEVFRVMKRTEWYELLLKFDDRRKRVTMIDIVRTVSWGASPLDVRYKRTWFRGVDIGFSRGIAWGIAEAFRLGKIYDYKFDPNEIKEPVLNTILASGWDARFGIW